MLSVRRLYIYLVSGISLQSVAWAVIYLLRSLLIPDRDASTLELAFFIAVIIIGFPIFLAHWLWARRLANGDPEEKAAIVRRAYLYGMMAAFLIPMIANVDGFVGSLLRIIVDVDPPRWFYTSLSPQNDLLNSAIAIVILGLLWLYHRMIVFSDAVQAPQVRDLATVRRLYIYAFSSAGLIMTASAAMNLLMWIMFKIWGNVGDNGPGSELFIVEEIARLVVGIPLWFIFWRSAQRLFQGDSEEERASALRKLYLYAVVFISAICAIFMIILLLSDTFRFVMNVPSITEPSQIRAPIATILVMALIWAYHTYVLRKDMLAADERPRQAQIRRLYFYLMAGIGLGAFLIGLAGILNVLIDGIAAGRYREALRDQASWFAAAIFVGLPVWLLPWWQAQRIAAVDNPFGESERQSIVRKIYLYLFLFAAAMTTLGSAVYIVSQIVDLALGGRSSTGLLSDLAQAIAFTLIAVSVWLYHSYVLRSDGLMGKVERSRRQSSLRVSVLDGGDGLLGRSLIDELEKELPDLIVQPVGLSAQAAEAMGTDFKEAISVNTIADSDVIVGSWSILASGTDERVPAVDIPATVEASEARKLIMPTWEGDYLWAGVDHWDDAAVVHQTVQALKQIAAGDEVKPTRPLGGAAILLIAAAGLIGVGIIASVIIAIFSEF